MKVNGEAIYGTTASPFKKQLPWGRCTQKTKGKTTLLFFHVFNWPTNGQLFVPGLRTTPRKSWPLTPRMSLPSKLTDDGLSITLPTVTPDPVSTTIVSQFLTTPVIESVYIAQQPDGTVMLPAVEAGLHGGGVRYEEGNGHDNIGYWLNPDDWVDWEFKVSAPGKYEVTAGLRRWPAARLRFQSATSPFIAPCPRRRVTRTSKRRTLAELRLPPRAA